MVSRVNAEMPFCVQCGNQVRDTDIFCGNCGARQRDAGGPVGRPPGADFLSGISPRTASLLCYIPVVGWVAAIVVLASARFRHDRNTRFHAWQGLYLFVAWLMIDWVVAPFFHMVPGPPFIVRGLKAVILVAWIFMIVKTNQDQVFRLPIVGELAERSLAEQR